MEYQDKQKLGSLKIRLESKLKTLELLTSQLKDLVKEIDKIPDN